MVRGRAALVIGLLLVTVGCGRIAFEAPIEDAGGVGGGSGLGGVGGGSGLGGGSGVGGSGGVSGSGAAGASGTTADGGPLDASGGDAAVDAGFDAATDAMVDAGSDASNTSCGNGTVESPEQCDDRGESSTCDADCTFAACADGTRNAAAGEACDVGPLASAACSATCEPVTCRAGCVCEHYRGRRYMFCLQDLDWATAQSACASENLRLVRIESATEHTWLRWRTVTSSFGKFHLGATDLASEGNWRWDDGSLFWNGVANGSAVGGAYTAWASGEPNSFVVGENCSEVQSPRGWNDCVCDLTKPFVCKDYPTPIGTCGNGNLEPAEACDGAGETSACDADCTAAACGDGVVNRARGEVCDDARTGDYCSPDCSAFLCPAGCACYDQNGRGYAVCPGAPTFQQAGVACGRFGMTLVRIEDAAVNTELRSRATQAGFGDIWIGGFDLDQANAWIWNDLSPLYDGTAGTGSATGYTHFAAGAPSGAANQDCLTMLSSGEWRDVDCGAGRPYACMRF